MVKAQVSAAKLKTPIDVSPLQSDSEAETLAVQVVLEKLYASRRPCFLVDGAVQRRRVSQTSSGVWSGMLTSKLQVSKQVNALVAKAGLPVYVAPMVP